MKRTVQRPYGDGRTTCITCGIKFGVVIQLSRSPHDTPLLRPTITTDENSGNGICTYCEPLYRTDFGVDDIVPAEHDNCVDCGASFIAKTNKVRCHQCQEFKERGVRFTVKFCMICYKRFSTSNKRSITCSQKCAAIRKRHTETVLRRNKRSKNNE